MSNYSGLIAYYNNSRHQFFARELSFRGLKSSKLQYTNIKKIFQCIHRHK
jgi:hypothetical protein